MKHIILLCDGMSDYPDLKDNSTPLTLANKPTFDILAQRGEVGLCQTVPHGMSPGSDTANLSVMGYDPKIYYTGRSPLEATGMGLDLSLSDVTYRLNLVTLSDKPNFYDKRMLDYSAGEISTEDATKVITLISSIVPKTLKLHIGFSYRHCLIRENGETGSTLTPPHDILNKNIKEYLPKNSYSDELQEFIKKSNEILSKNPLNSTKANAVWIWGEGRKPNLDSFENKFNKKGAVVSAVDLIKGIGKCAKMPSPNIEGATGTVHTNFDNKLATTKDLLKTNDFVYIHIEAPDEAGHQGSKSDKIKSIELIDTKILKPLCDYFKNNNEDFNILILPDHATPLILRTHVSDPVPYIFYDSRKIVKGIDTFNEFSAKNTNLLIDKGHEIILKLFKD